MGMTAKVVQLAALLAALALIAAACGSDSSETTVPDPATDPVDLGGTRWVADKITIGAAPVPIVPNAQPTLDFNDDGRSFGGSTGCNSYFGEYVQGDGTIQFGGMGMTEMACEPPLMQQESNVFSILEAASVFTLADGVLVIGQVGGSTIEFIDRAVAFPDVELTGTQWVADTIISGGAASTMVPNAPVTLFIDAAASQATGSTGCNEYTASVEPGRTQLTFGQMAVTERGCVGEGIMDQEQFVLAIFQGELQVTIEGDRLTLLDRNGDGLGFKAAE